MEVQKDGKVVSGGAAGWQGCKWRCSRMERVLVEVQQGGNVVSGGAAGWVRVTALVN